MNFLIFFIAVLLLYPSVASSQGNQSGNSFSKAKKILHKAIHVTHRVTLYAQCTYNADKRVDWASCGLSPRKQPKRAARVEWEHVVPAWEFGHQMQCWQKGGRKACRKTPAFKRLESDMHNLRPAVGELNGDRSNYRYGMVSGEPRAYGDMVDFEVDFKQRVAEPAPQIRGDIARTYFYMAKEYSLTISKKHQKLFNAWDRQDPVSDWEIKRNELIHTIQGNYNTFIKGQ